MAATFTFPGKRVATLLVKIGPSLCCRKFTHSQSLWEELLGRKIDPAAAKKLEDAFLEYRVRKSVPSWLPFLPNCSFWIPSSEETIKNLKGLAERIKVSKPSRKGRMLYKWGVAKDQGKITSISKVTEWSLIQQTDRLLSSGEWVGREATGQGSLVEIALGDEDEDDDENEDSEGEQQLEVMEEAKQKGS